MSPPTVAVATPHPAAAEAGRQILLHGGNAVDAAVGALLACCVALPGSVGLGGYGGSLVAFMNGKAVALDFDSRAPLAFRPELFQRKDYDSGYLSIGVPAVVAGLEAALRQFGSLPWAAVAGPALRLAERGVPVTAELRQQFDAWCQKADALSRHALLPNGLPDVGTLWTQPDLGRLLRRLAEDGPAAFYHGDIPRQIMRQVREHGGILTEDDFARYQPEIVEPLAVTYRGFRVLTAPPPSGGLTSLQILKTLEQFQVASLPPWGAEYFHLVAEAAKLAWQDRARYIGDPAVAPVPVERLLSDPAVIEKAELIRQGRIGHTVNVVAADAAGNLASITATHGMLYGSTVAIDGLGLLLGHGMSRFDLGEGSPNAPAPGKRMCHNMAPTVVLRPDGKPFAALGLPGGTKIVTVTPQLVVSLVDFGAVPQEAVHAGRIHAEPNGAVAVSAAVPEAVVQELRARGHVVRRGQDVGGPPSEIGGPANVVSMTDTGEVAAASQAGADAASVVHG